MLKINPAVAAIEEETAFTVLDRANMFACDMREADLRQASMLKTDLRGASLRGADLTTLSALASEPVQTSLWDETSPIPHTRLGQGADLVVVVPATARLLAAYAAAGLMTLPDLRDRFDAAAAAAVRAAAVPDDTAGWLRRILDRVMSLATIRRVDGDERLARADGRRALRTARDHQLPRPRAVRLEHHRHPELDPDQHQDILPAHLDAAAT